MGVFLVIFVIFLILMLIQILWMATMIYKLRDSGSNWMMPPVICGKNSPAGGARTSLRNC